MSKCIKILNKTNICCLHRCFFVLFVFFCLTAKCTLLNCPVADAVFPGGKDYKRMKNSFSTVKAEDS